VPSKAEYYQVRDPSFQGFKLHFHCLKPSQEDRAYLQELLQRWRHKATRRRLAPCCKVFDADLARGHEGGLEFERLNGHASGTLYLAQFEDSDPHALACLALDLSNRFSVEDITKLDYAAGFLPYCPGVYLRQSFHKVSVYPDRHEYVPGLHAEKALRDRGENPAAYGQLLTAVKIRGQLRESPMYAQFCAALHDKRIAAVAGLVAASRVGETPSVVAADFTAAIKELLMLMRGYKTKGYYFVRKLRKSLATLKKAHPAVTRGALAEQAQAFESELVRAEQFLRLRLRYKAKMDPWIREQRGGARSCSKTAVMR
jgi:hypothetical protein